MTREEKIIQERQEIEGILRYFAKNKLDNKSLGIYKEIEECITNVFRLEIEEMGYELDTNGTNNKNGFNLDIKFDSKDTRGGSCSPTRVINNGRLQQIKPSIMYNLYTMCKGLDSDDKEIRLTTVKNMFKTVFHELQHHRQERMASSNVSSKDAIAFARDFTLHRYLAKEFYTGDGKTGNYNKLLTENNANEIGYSQYLEIIGHGDSEVSDLRDIETGKSNTSQYKIDINSFDNKSHYKTNGLEERMEAAIPIIDDLIMNRGFTEILELYPILQKEYNLDGSKKSTIDLIRNMQKESGDILQMQGLSEKEKTTLIKDSQEMYYELIYRSIEKISSSQLKETKSQISEEQFNQILDKMEHYFQDEMESKIGKSAAMASAQSRNDKAFIAPSNDGTIQMIVDGKTKTLTVDDFIQTIDSKLMQKQFDTPKGVFNASDFIRKFCFQYLAQDGIMTLKDGQQLSAKEFVEKYMLQKMQLSIQYPPRKYIEDTIQSENPWKIHQKTRDRLVDYYEGKKKVIREIAELEIEDTGKEKEIQSKTVQLTPEQQAKKMAWIKDFINNYDCTETEQQYDYRISDEDSNMQQVLSGIEKGVFIGEGLSSIDLNYFPNDKEFSIERSMPKIARLLKAADNLTIDGGRNYLEEFANIPNINSILLQVKKSESVKQMAKKAEENRQNGLVPKYKTTRAESDKSLAQNYLKSSVMRKLTPKDEIAYRTDILRGADEVIVDSDAKTVKDVSLLKRQKTALMRTIARQQGKIPSGVIFENGRCYFMVDTQQEKSHPQQINYYATDISETWGEIKSPSNVQTKQDKLSMNDLKRDLVRSKIEKSETQKQMSNMAKINEVRRLQKMELLGHTLTKEQKLLLEEHKRITQQIQIDYQNRQNEKKHKNHGLEM